MGSLPHTTFSRATRRLLAATVTIAALAATAAVTSAQSPLPAGSPGRFTMQPADGGVLRMDTQTGSLSMCRQVSGSWSCNLLPDDRATANDEIERLKTENTDLKSAVKRLEELAGVPAGSGSDAGGGKRQSGVQLPTEEELDKAMSYVERMLKKFKDKIKELEGPDGKRGTQL